MNLLEAVTRRASYQIPSFLDSLTLCVCQVYSAYVSTSEPKTYSCHEILLAPVPVLGAVAENSGLQGVESLALLWGSVVQW